MSFYKSWTDDLNIERDGNHVAVGKLKPLSPDFKASHETVMEDKWNKWRDEEKDEWNEEFLKEIEELSKEVKEKTESLKKENGDKEEKNKIEDDSLMLSPEQQRKLEQLAKEKKEKYQQCLKDSGKREQYSSGAVREPEEGKGSFNLIPFIGLKKVAEIARKGGEGKYGKYNWEKGTPLTRIMSSAKRHLDQFQEGQEDEDHLHLCIWNMLALSQMQEMIKRGLVAEEFDDLPSYGMDGKSVEVFPGVFCDKWRKPGKGYLLEIEKKKKDQ